MNTTRFAAPHCATCPSYDRSLLHTCSGAAHDQISDSKTAQQYAGGQVIFQEGSRALGLYCVHSGLIKISKTGGDGKEQIVRLARGGGMLGFRGLVTGTLHSTTAVALDASVVCLVRKQDFFAEMADNRAFSGELIQLLAKALLEVEERMLHLAYKPVRERLAEALLLLLRMFRAEDQLVPPAFAISRDDLGALMGTTKETTTRMLSEFKAEGMLTTKGSAITILEPQRLMVIATRYD